MNASRLILLASAALLLIVILLLALIGLGVRRGDHGDLTKPAQNRIDAISRRVVGVGVRNHTGSEEGDR
jgi:hypothetical protein